jgi:hypothetical protein
MNEGQDQLLDAIPPRIYVQYKLKNLFAFISSST